MKKNIGIDIDSTIFSTEENILNYIGLFYNEVFHKRQIKNNLYDLKVDDFVIHDAIDLAVSDTKLKRYSYSKRCIQWLSEFFNIFFITYRDPKFITETHELLSILNVYYNLVFCTREEGKHDFVIENDIKIVIEDDADSIENIAIDATVLIYDQPWNQNIAQDFNKIRVYNWKEIKDAIIILGV